MPGTDSLTQEELDENLAGEMTNELWTEALKESGMKGVVVESVGVEKQNERNTYYAIVTYDDDDGVHLKMKAIVHFVPGWSYSVLCAARLDGYDKETADFDVIFRSFTPLSRALIAAREPQRPSATLSTVKPDSSMLSATTARSGKALRALFQQTRRGRHK